MISCTNPINAATAGLQSILTNGIFLLENCYSLITEPSRAVTIKPQISMMTVSLILFLQYFMLFRVSPKRNEEWGIKRADKIVESILNSEFKYVGLLYRNVYVRSVITLFETAPLAVPPKNREAGMDCAIDTGTTEILFQGLCSFKTVSDQ